jgi:FdhD protein
MSDQAPLPARPVSAAGARRVTRDGTVEDTTLLLAEEAPIALVFNGVSHAVMLATPADLADFGLGFALSEGIVANKAELVDLEVGGVAAGFEVRMAITLPRVAALKERRRNLVGRTGCGICGVDSIEQALRPVPEVPAKWTVGNKAVHAALDALPAVQAVNRATGALHAAAFADRQGRLLLAREDVGRHNALDKLVGGLARAGIDPASGFVVITSRCSVEMVQKAAMAGVPLLVAISAPTMLAKRTAEACGLTLLALARTDSVLAVSHPWRFIA